MLSYKFGLLGQHDWRGLGVGLGLMAILPLSYVFAVNASQGSDAVKEVLVTMSISEKTPVRLYFGLLAACVLAGVLSSVSLILKR
jgi:hypothetical protein